MSTLRTPAHHDGYFDQTIGLDGWQRDSDDPVDPTVNPVVRNGVTFYPGDLEGILSLVYSRNLPTKFLSSRCDKEDPNSLMLCATILKRRHRMKRVQPLHIYSHIDLIH